MALNVCVFTVRQATSLSSLQKQGQLNLACVPLSEMYVHIVQGL